MRFQRHARIFRGQLDAAPVAGVCLLLVIFVLLSSLVYTPGVLVELKEGETPLASTIVVTATNTVIFAGKVYGTNEFDKLRADIGSLNSSDSLGLKMDSGASSKLREQVRELMSVTPPVMVEGMVGTDDPVVIVAVNLRGQFFYENHMVQETELKAILENQLKAASGMSKDLTLVLIQDNAVPAKTFVQLTSLAKKVGIKKVLIGTRPGTFSKTTTPRKP